MKTEESVAHSVASIPSSRLLYNTLQVSGTICLIICRFKVLLVKKNKKKQLKDQNLRPTGNLGTIQKDIEELHL